MGRHRLSARCATEGCEKTTFWTFDRVKDYAAKQAEHHRKPWRCIFHDGHALYLTGKTRVSFHESSPIRQESYGRFFGNAGIIYGPGFVVRADDWPVGTVLRVQAEIIVPEAPPAPGGTAGSGKP